MCQSDQQHLAAADQAKDHQNKYRFAYWVLQSAYRILIMLSIIAKLPVFDLQPIATKVFSAVLVLMSCCVIWSEATIFTAGNPDLSPFSKMIK